MTRLNRSSCYWLSAALLGLVFSYLSEQPAMRVGDGAEYYALYYAWTDSLRPWMTSVSFASYQALIDSTQVAFMPSLQHLMEKFPELRVGETADFNHFWFYSFLAYLVALPLDAVGLHLPAHHSFLVLHFVLLLLMFVVFIRLYGPQGLLAAVIMTFLSPMLWYLDKVHTELLTFVFSMLAVALIHRRFYLAGAFFLATASTQNPSFALVAFIPFCYRVLVKRKEPLSVPELALLLATALLVLLHPTYYFFRYGAPTPQLLTMGADLGANLSTFYIWLLDPDVGLLPFWPIGLLVLGLACSFVYIKKPLAQTAAGGFGFQVFFMLSFLLINLYAHSSTENLNSGAGAGPARYALWYLPLFLPLLLYVLTYLREQKTSLMLSVVLLGLSAWYNFKVSAPSNNDNLPHPSALSSFIQRHFSTLYSPHHEIFIEKYSGYGESVGTVNPRAIIGPDCAKVLVIPGGGKTKVLAPAECFFEQSKVLDVINTATADSPETTPFYIWLNQQQVAASKLALVAGDYAVGVGFPGNVSLVSGWSLVEAAGVWSDGSMSVFRLPCSAEQFYFQRDVLHVRLQLAPFGQQSLMIKYQQKALYTGEINAAVTLEFELALEQCRHDSIDLEFHLATPRSPFEMGMSDDRRKLGIWLSGYSLY
ncbi:hypothetical protein [Rheinheimera sp.]|uniref:hypothetical protein n=1 Tax=Rheinheimera sp. TaxID=1869214 RepID=UPI003AF9EB0F